MATRRGQGVATEGRKSRRREDAGCRKPRDIDPSGRLSGPVVSTSGRSCSRDLRSDNDRPPVTLLTCAEQDWAPRHWIGTYLDSPPPVRRSTRGCIASSRGPPPRAPPRRRPCCRRAWQQPATAAPRRGPSCHTRPCPRPRRCGCPRRPRQPATHSLSLSPSLLKLLTTPWRTWLQRPPPPPRGSPSSPPPARRSRGARGGRLPQRRGVPGRAPPPPGGRTPTVDRRRRAPGAPTPRGT